MMKQRRGIEMMWAEGVPDDSSYAGTGFFGGRGGSNPAATSTVFFQQYINVVDSSFKSDTAIRIIRQPSQKEKKKQKSDNPYVFQPKSYSSKRSSKLLDKPAVVLEPVKLKKPRLERPQEESKRENGVEKQSIQLPPVAAYFKQTFFAQKLQENIELDLSSIFLSYYPIKLTSHRTKYIAYNKDSLDQIEIVANDNSKQVVYIHNALLQANNPKKLLPGVHFFQNVVNPFNLQRRDHFMKTINFITNYKSGYAPIEMQENNETDVAKLSAGKHFIKKKQSTLSLPRTCGVSYVKPSQSEQKQPFAPLPPLMFQCSSSCDAEKAVPQSYCQIKKQWDYILDQCWLQFVSTDEDNMRDLLLGKNIGKIHYVNGIKNLWPLLAQGVFIALAITNDLAFDADSAWKAFHQSQIKIGILTKKSTSGKKAFFKSIGLDIGKEDQGKPQGQTAGHQQLSVQDVQGVMKTAKDKYGDECANFLREFSMNRTVTTLSLRMQMYVQQDEWARYSKQLKNCLNKLILDTKTRLQCQSLDIIKKRYGLSKVADKAAAIAQDLLNIRLPNDNAPNDEAMPYDLASVDIEAALRDVVISRTVHLSRVFQFSRPLKTEEYMSVRGDIMSDKSQSLKMPLYYISTRDSFAFDLVVKETFLKTKNRSFTKCQYFFDPDNLPANYGEFRKLFPNLEVGIVCYNGFYSNQELQHFEKSTFQTQKKAFLNSFLQMTVQPTIVGNKIKRTKFFFGYRYMWTRCQLAQPNSYVGAGVRKDVTPAPGWVKDVEAPLVQQGIVPRDFINSVAINVYHDGKEGLAQHFDDAVRFKQPIYTLRLFSDARLSFGSQLYGFCNGAFVIPLPRGCICVMKENSYAANGVKHCVRPCDMTGKSAAIILRQMHSLVTNQVDRYDELVDFPLWVSTLSADRNAVSYAEQKRREAEYLISKPKGAT